MDFVMIANDWRAGIDNPTSKHRIAIELARRGNRVLWLEGSGMRQPSLTSGADRSRIWTKLKKAFDRPTRVKDSADLAGEIYVASPLLLPLPARRWARLLNGAICRRTAAGWARKTGDQKPVLINYVPTLVDAMRSWPGKRVYHCVDRWDAFSTYDSRLMTEMDALCCRNADVVIASSEDLAERCRRHNPKVNLITHGVDHAHFAQAVGAQRPADLPAGKIIGFIGLISEWLDQELIAKLARSLPDARVVLIGKADVAVERLEGIPNVHLLGPRPFRELPAYLGSFDVGIIPFVINDLTRAVNPIKLREMLSGGCPVVSTPLPEVARLDGLAGAVDVAHTHDEFIACVRERMTAPSSLDQRRAISRSMAGETWSKKVDQILAAAEAG